MSASKSSPWSVFLIFLQLGCTSFGGPVAHLGYFREALVARRRWLDEGAYAELVALCQFLPGPASSQVSFALGLFRAGLPGACAAWLGFTLPSALLMLGFAYGLSFLPPEAGAPWLHGLKLAAAAVVAQALFAMARGLCPDGRRLLIALAAGGLAASGGGGQLAALGLGAVAGMLVLRRLPVPSALLLPVAYSRRRGLACLALALALLMLLPLLAQATGAPLAELAERFYRAGALVFGGGHVVLPLLQAELVPAYVGAESFLAGYGAAQALPGPLFSFAAFLGGQAGGVSAALSCLFMVFLPGCLLLLAALPFWRELRVRPGLVPAVAGVNASVVGLLAAAFYDPVLTGALERPVDLLVVLAACALLHVARTPPWAVVALCALAGPGLA